MSTASRKKLNVIVLNDFGHVNGGAAQVAISSALGLATNGHKVTFFAAVSPIADSLHSHNIKTVLTSQYEIKNDPSRIRAVVQGVWNLKSAHKLAEVLETCDPSCTIIHLHGWSKSLSSSPVREAIRGGFKAVCTLHDYFYACPNGGFYNFRKKQICPLQPLSAECVLENCDRDGYPQKLWRCVRQGVQNRFGFTDLNNFIVLSEFSRSRILPFLPKDARVFFVPNPIEAKKQPRVAVETNSEFLAIGRISPEKGFGLFAAAAAQLDLSAAIVGDGIGRNEVQAIYPKLRVTGWQSAEEVKASLRRARAVVFPSVWFEAQPLVVAEATAMGVPVIVADTCAGRDAVVNGATGLWFEGGNVEDLKNKIKRLLDPSTALDMSVNAYKKYWEMPFDIEKHTSALEACYDEILSKSEGRV